MRRCVSYSFFRHDSSHYEHPNCGEARGKVFLNYLRLIIRAHHVIWRGYDLIFHHDHRVTEFPYFRVMERARDAGLLQLIQMGRADTLCGSMLWRMRPIWDGYDLVVCRDVDSIPLPRDRRAVEEFAGTTKWIHVIHDAGAHSGIMGGTSSFLSFPHLVNVKSWEHFVDLQAKDGPPEDWNKHGKDQNFLNKWLWPKYAWGTMVHELHHLTDMASAAAIVKRSISIEAPADLKAEVAEVGDSFSPVLGGCWDVEKPYAFYDGLDNVETWMIKEIEREVLG